MGENFENEIDDMGLPAWRRLIQACGLWPSPKNLKNQESTSIGGGANNQDPLFLVSYP